MKIDFFLVLATNKRLSNLILKYNWDIGAAIIVKIDAKIEDVPPTLLKTSRSPWDFQL